MLHYIEMSNVFDMNLGLFGFDIYRFKPPRVSYEVDLIQ